jgi:hypothetical protein
MIVHWEGHDALAWDALHAAAAGALQQDWAYGSSLKMLGVPVLRAQVSRDGEPVAQAQFIVRQWGRLGAIALCTRGPLWHKPLTPEEEAQAYGAMKNSLPLKGIRFMAVSPEVPKGHVHGLSPLRRIYTGLSTVILDLTVPLDTLRARLDRRWRHRLVGAQGSEMTVERVGTNAGQYRWLLEAEMQQRTEKKLDGLPLAFFDHYAQSRKQPSKNILTLRADKGRERVAGMMFLLHGEAATYHVGWTSEQGREMHAHNLILWKAIEELKSRGIRVLDLGGVNTTRSAGIARFKMSTGGQVLTLAGTYI